MPAELTPGRDLFDTKRKILTADMFSAVRDAVPLGSTVVVAGGGFDILHYGHISFLESARQLGDVLFVLVSSDESLRKKGELRPVQTQQYRSRIVASLECVSFVAPIAFSTGVETVSKLRPDVYAKGSDYSWETTDPIYREYLVATGVPIAYVGYHGNIKTSGIIRNIQNGAK